MKLEEALGLVEEVKNCSLPWDDAHWDALGIVIDYVKNKSHATWKPTEEQIKALNIAIRWGINPSTWEGDALRSLLEQLKQL